MKIDITSMFFNSSIEGKTATPAWGTSIGQSSKRDYRIDDSKDGVVNMLMGMTYKSVSDLSKLDVSQGSSKREVLICSIFTDIFINDFKIKDSQFVLLLVREHSLSHNGRLIISYAPYIKYNGISNQDCISKMQGLLCNNDQGSWFVYDISIENQSVLRFSAVVIDADNPKNYGKDIKSQDRSYEWNSLIPENISLPNFFKFKKEDSFQKIFYGAPGTGKSNTINKKTKGEEVIRITFHPDTDYSTFVGAYKPTTDLLPICNELGEPMKIANQALYKEQIVYEFVPQAFLLAYIAAWKNYADADVNNIKKQYLVIEEINRGNCAQIFGDLFQLLDRNDKGFSEYPINADSDMKKQLNKAFRGLEIPQKDSINAMFEGLDVVKRVLDGDLLLLPNNLYIWATMNTSDQSLFPIDSAFKRRWDWKYIPISDAGKGWVINVNGNNYDWWDFLEKINAHIDSTTNSEDKKLGYFFCKANDNNEISAETFVGKVIFYLWNDVFKDYDFSDKIFYDEKGDKLTFNRFYTAEGVDSKVVEDLVELFLKNLKLNPIVYDETASTENMENEGDKDNTQYSINGEGNFPKRLLAKELITRFVKNHPELSADKVIDMWKPLSNVGHFVENDVDHEKRTDDGKNRAQSVICNDGTILWVATHGWIPDTINNLIDNVNSKDWDLKVKTIE